MRFKAGKITAISLSVFFSILAGAGCRHQQKPLLQNTTSSIPVFTLPETTTTTIKEPIPLTASEQKRLLDFYTTNYFRKKLIPFDSFLGDGKYDRNATLTGRLTTYSRSDCLGYEGGQTMGGDLLTTLLRDPRVPAEFKTLDDEGSESHLSAFTPAYLQKLLTKTDMYLRKIYPGHSLYSYYLCHLGDSFDILSGNVWEDTKSPYRINETTGHIETTEAFSASPIILVIRNNKVEEYKNIETLGVAQMNTQTYPCSASLTYEDINWTCFAGLYECPGYLVTVARQHSWIIFEDGTVLTKPERLYPTCEEKALKNAQEIDLSHPLEPGPF